MERGVVPAPEMIKVIMIIINKLECFSIQLTRQALERKRKHTADKVSFTFESSIFKFDFQGILVQNYVSRMKKVRVGDS